MTSLLSVNQNKIWQNRPTKFWQTFKILVSSFNLKSVIFTFRQLNSWDSFLTTMVTVQIQLVWQLFNMPPPSDISSLWSFLQLVSHYGSFLPSLHQLKAPLNKQLSKDIKWTWPIDSQQSFEKIKASLNSKLLLTYFDPIQKIAVAGSGRSDFTHFCWQIRKGYNACSQIPDACWTQQQPSRKGSTYTDFWCEGISKDVIQTLLQTSDRP